MCGNLAVVRPPALTLPSQVVTGSSPVFRCIKRTQARTCPATTCGIAADLPVGWQSPIVACDAGCQWVRLQGCGGGGQCWALASDGLVTGDLSRFSTKPAAGLPRYTWTTPAQVSGTGEGGINQAVVQDGQGRLIATWEEHLPSTGAAPFYGPVHYRVWDGSRWTETMAVPGSEDHGEALVTALADGSVLLAAADMNSKYAWWRWQDGAWSPAPEMALQVAQNGSGMAGLVADGASNVYVFTPKARVWNGRAWSDANDIGFVPWRGAVRDSRGRVHAIAPTYGAQRELVHWLWQDGAWKRQSVVYRAPAKFPLIGSWFSAAAGPDGALHAVWPSGDADFAARVDGTPHNEWISYSRWDGTGWSPAQIAAGPLPFTKGGIDAADMALLPDGNVVIAYAYTGGSGGAIGVVWGHDGAWSEPVLFTSPERVSDEYPGVGVDRQGHIHIFWWRGGHSSVWYVMGAPQ